MFIKSKQYKQADSQDFKKVKFITAFNLMQIFINTICYRDYQKWTMKLKCEIKVKTIECYTSWLTLNSQFEKDNGPSCSPVC